MQPRSLVNVLAQYSFQAHRSGLAEAPENTLEGVLYCWQFSPAVPEVDVRTTSDGKLICLHDQTLQRTGHGSAKLTDRPVRDLTSKQLETCRVRGPHEPAGMTGMGSAGRRIPFLDDILQHMCGNPGRRLYLDIKDADLDTVINLVQRRGLVLQTLFVHHDPDTCELIRSRNCLIETMTWCSGTVAEIKSKFASVTAREFRGLTQLQLHLPVCSSGNTVLTALPHQFLVEAVHAAHGAGVELQICPYGDTPAVLRWLLDLGIRWFVTDAPLRFIQSMQSAIAHAGDIVTVDT